MNRKARKPADVFLSHAAVDAAVAEAVVRHFEAAGLVVFPAAGLGGDAGQAAAVREGLRESAAFVALLTPSLARSDSLTIEVGAAWMGAIPIYLLLSDIGKAEVPAYLRRYKAVPLWAGLDALIDEVRRLAEPLAEGDRAALAAAYRDVGVSSDRLISTPAARERLAEAFGERTGRSLPTHRLVRELLHLRKARKLPRFGRKAVG